MPELLQGAAFVERSAFVAAPLAGRTLAQMGAVVIKIDDLRGGPDWTRWPLGPDGSSLYWAELNRGKKSVLLDMHCGEGRELAAALTATAGGYLTNLDSRAPLASDALIVQRPDLIYLLIEGNADGRVAIDYTVNAALGHPYAVGPSDHVGPINHQLPVWDISTGLLAAASLSAAVQHRTATGSGTIMRTTLFDVGLALTGALGWLAEAQMNNAGRPRIGNAIYGAFGHEFTTLDGATVMVAAVTARQWDALVSATETSEVLTLAAKNQQLDLDSDSGRYHATPIIAGIMSGWFSARTLAEASQVLSAHGVCWDQYHELPEFVRNDPRASTDNPIVSFEGDRKVAGFPIVASSTSDPERAHSPNRGEHTETVLADLLGLSDRQIGQLLRRRIVACSPAKEPGRGGR